MAILACARHRTSHHEWTAHKRIALAAGLEPEVVADIAARRDSSLADLTDRCVLEATQAMLRTGRLDDRFYGSALAALGEAALVELTALVGYYTMVALNPDRVPARHPRQRRPRARRP